MIQHATGPYEFTLDNGQHVRSARKGDEIINTPQEGFLFVTREGVPMPEDFLPMNEGQ